MTKKTRIKRVRETKRIDGIRPKTRRVRKRGRRKAVLRLGHLYSVSKLLMWLKRLWRVKL